MKVQINLLGLTQNLCLCRGDWKVALNFPWSRHGTDNAPIGLLVRRSHLCLFLIVIWVITGLGCGGDSSSVDSGEGSEQPPSEEVPQFGTVSGIITDAKTGNPIQGVTVSLLDQKVETGADGRYAFTEIRYSDNHSLTVMGMDHQTKAKPFELKAEQVQLNIALDPKFGAVSGVITDGTTRNPIQGATVELLDKSMTTEANGAYNFIGIPYSENLSLTVIAADYQPKTENFQLRTDRLGLNILLMPLTDPEMEIIQFLERFSALIESLDISKLGTIQELFSESYITSDDPVTLLGLAAGVIPAKFDEVIPTITAVFEKYDVLQFQFNKIRVEVTNSRQASARLSLHIISEHGPRPDRREMIVDCQMDFRKEDALWKIVFWQLFNIEFIL